MNVSNIDAAVSNVNLKSAVSVKVAAKAMDAAKAEGEAVVELIKSASAVGTGGVDSAGRLDVQA